MSNCIQGLLTESEPYGVNEIIVTNYFYLEYITQLPESRIPSLSLPLPNLKLLPCPNALYL